MMLFISILCCSFILASAIPYRGLFEGDIQLTKDVVEEMKGNIRYDAAIKHKWTAGIIPYKFDSKFPSGARRLVGEAISEFESNTCLVFKQRRREYNYVEFKYISRSGCSSRVGRGGGKQVIVIGGGCLKKGSVMHEIMHAIGFYHEQSRLDRDKYIKIYWDRIEKDMKFNFEMYSHGEADYLGEPYDYDSIMHYRPTAFGDGKITLEARGNPKRSLGQRIKLTDIDKRQINKMYNCKSQPTSKPVTKKPLVTSNCKDLDSKCPELAKDGHCTAFWVGTFMKKKCRRSCYFC